MAIEPKGTVLRHQDGDTITADGTTDFGAPWTVIKRVGSNQLQQPPTTPTPGVSQPQTQRQQPSQPQTSTGQTSINNFVRFKTPSGGSVLAILENGVYRVPTAQEIGSVGGAIGGARIVKSNTQTPIVEFNQQGQEPSTATQRQQPSQQIQQPQQPQQPQAPSIDFGDLGGGNVLPTEGGQESAGSTTATTSPEASQQPGFIGPVQTGVPGRRTYTVQAGDTLSRIARKLGVSVNNITGFRSGNPALIFPGETLDIGGRGSVPTLPPPSEPGVSLGDDLAVEPVNNAQITLDTIETNLDVPPPTEQDFLFNPEGSITDYIEQIMSALNIGDVSKDIDDISKQLEDLENERDEEIADINDNPFISESDRSNRVIKVKEKFENKINNRVNRLRLLGDVRDDARQQAQFAATMAVNIFDRDRNFRLDQLEFLADRAEARAKDVLSVSEAKELGVPFGTTKTAAGRLNIIPGRGGGAEIARTIDVGGQIIAIDKQGNTIATYQKGVSPADALKNAQADLQGEQSSANTVGLLNRILADPDLDDISGTFLGRLFEGAGKAGTASLRGQMKQLQALTSLEGRSQLKGSGTISDFEAGMLANSANAINFAIQENGSIAMAEDDVVTNLRNIRGVLQSKAGELVTFYATDPRDMENTKKFENSTREDIQEAALLGFIINY